MKRTRLYVSQSNIDPNYSAHKGYVSIPLKVRNVKSICLVLHNAEGFISLFKELDEEQILNEMRLEDDKQHFNSKKIDVDVTPDNADFKYILRLTKINTKFKGYRTVVEKVKEKLTDENGKEKEVETEKEKDIPVYDTTCTLKIIIEYEEEC